MSKSNQVRIVAVVAWGAVLAATVVHDGSWDVVAALPIYLLIGGLLGTPAMVAQWVIVIRSRFGPEREFAVVHYYLGHTLSSYGTTGNRWLAELAAEQKYLSVQVSA